MSRQTTRPVAGAALCLAGLALLGLFLYSAAGVSLDERMMRSATHLYRPSAMGAADAFVGLGDPAMAFLICVGLATVAMLRRGPRLAALALAIPAGAALSTGVLKHTLTQARVCGCIADDRVGAGAWPSGHATIATALTLSAVIIAAPRFRPAVALAGGGVLAAFYGALLVMGWHYPTDLVGALLMAALWAIAGLAVFDLAERRWPSRAGRESRAGIRDAWVPLGAGFTAVAFLASAAVFARRLTPQAVEHGYASTLVAGALVAAACGVLAVALAVTLRR